MAKPITEFRRQTARRLRVSATQPEQKLWRALKRVPTFGSHFRRQAPIGRYVVDFACMRAKLVIELDGGHHSDDKVAAKDAMRTRWLEGQGYKVLRFWNAELNSNLVGVLDTFYAALYGTPSAEARRFSRTHVARREPVEGETKLSTSSSPHPGENASHSRRPSPSRGG